MADESMRPGVTDEQRALRHESRANQTFMRFIRDLCANGRFDEVFATRAAAEVLCRLEMRLTADETQNLEAQLPAKLREILAVCERPKQGGPVWKFGRVELLSLVAKDLGCSEDEAERIIRAVFTTLREHISEGEVHSVASQLPRDLEPLWAEPM